MPRSSIEIRLSIPIEAREQAEKILSKSLRFNDKNEIYRHGICQFIEQLKDIYLDDNSNTQEQEMQNA